MKRAIQMCLIAGVFSLASCAGVKQAGHKSASFVQSTTSAASSAASSGFGALANLMPGRRIKVVEVREKDLREMPMGHEKAITFQNTRKGGFWIFGGPVNFTEPALPDAGGEPDGSLLPPKVQ
jgi:hypothetical protein